MENDDDGRVVLSILRLDGFRAEDPSLFEPIAEECGRSGEEHGMMPRVLSRHQRFRRSQRSSCWQLSLLFLSEQVLSCLAEDPDGASGLLTRVYLGGLSAALVDAVLREDVWEVYAVLDRTLHVRATAI